MSGEQAQYRHEPTPNVHRLTWPDGVVFEVRSPQRDALRRLKAEVITWVPGHRDPLSRAVIDLLSEVDRARFHQNLQARVALLNGAGEGLKSIDWFTRLLAA
jgi:hypothetical protein